MLNHEIVSGHEINPDNGSISGSQFAAIRPSNQSNMDQEQMFKMFEMF